MSTNTRNAKKYYDKAIHALEKNDTETAIHHLHRALPIFQDAEDYDGYLKAINALGVSYANSGNEITAVEYYLTGLDIIRKEKIDGYSHLFFNNIGSQYMELGMYDKAHEYYTAANKIMTINGRYPDSIKKQWIVITNLNLGTTLFFLNRIEEAEKALSYTQKVAAEYNINEFDFSLQCLTSLLHLKKGDNSYAEEHITGMVESAISELAIITGYLINIDMLSQILVKLNRMDEYLLLINSFSEFAEQHNNVTHRLKVSDMRLEYYELTDKCEDYIAECIAHTKYYKEAKLYSNIEKSKSLDMSIRLHAAVEDAKDAIIKGEEDALTGIYNRHGMHRHAEEIVAQVLEEKALFSVVLSDIDYFKQYNDEYGHLEGDRVLCRVAELLKNVIGDNGKVFRFGGDEFLILMKCTCIDDIEEKIKEIQEAIKNEAMENIASETEKYITVSHGIHLCIPRKGENLEDYIGQADIKLYEAKKLGRNTFCIQFKENQKDNL